MEPSINNEIRLRWTSHQGTILSIFDILLSNETLVDVTLGAEGQFIRAHRLVLSACSPYFQDLLALDTTKHPILLLKDVKFTELKALVQYMYRGEVSLQQDDLQSLLAVAQSLKIRGLAEEVVSNKFSLASTSATTITPPCKPNRDLPSDTLLIPNTKVSQPQAQVVPIPLKSTPQQQPLGVQIQQVQTPKDKVPLPKSRPGPASSKRPKIQSTTTTSTTSTTLPRIIHAPLIRTEQDPLAPNQSNFQSFPNVEIEEAEAVKLEVTEVTMEHEIENDMDPEQIMVEPEVHDGELSGNYGSDTFQFQIQPQKFPLQKDPKPRSIGSTSNRGRRSSKNKAKPYKCSKCSSCYLHASSLTLHTNDKICDIFSTGLGFKTKTTESPPFECDVCHKTYTTRFNLNRHKQYECNLPAQFGCSYNECGKRYRSPAGHNKHILSVHKKKCKK